MIEGNQHGGQHAAGARRGRRHNPAHAGVGLAGAKGGGDDRREIRPRKGVHLRRIVAHLLSVAAHQSAGGEPVAPVGVHCLQHGPPRNAHFFHGRLRRHAPLLHVGIQHHFPELPAAHIGGVKNLLHGIQCHYASSLS
ncbi:hypothetical protein SDC9_121875 [bioreactor metagenome]|uniref:Uncharacterized protein n=1 Tax=bioreactor metagenome TaxID=1076179 RepID=A0A645CD36_9ZZZZ